MTKKWNEQTFADFQKDKRELEEKIRDLLREFKEEYGYWLKFDDQPIRVRWSQYQNEGISDIKIMVEFNTRLF